MTLRHCLSGLLLAFATHTAAASSEVHLQASWTFGGSGTRSAVNLNLHQTQPIRWGAQTGQDVDLNLPLASFQMDEAGSQQFFAMGVPLRGLNAGLYADENEDGYGPDRKWWTIPLETVVTLGLVIAACNYMLSDAFSEAFDEDFFEDASSDEDGQDDDNSNCDGADGVLDPDC